MLTGAAQTGAGARLRRGALLLGVLVVAVVGAAVALGGSGGSSLPLLPPTPQSHPAPKAGKDQPPAAGNGEDVTRIVHPDLSHRGPIAAGGPPGTSALAGAPRAVLSRFATLWANRSITPDLQTQTELIGLSGGAWAKRVIRAVPLSLPSIPGVRVRGSLVVFRLRESGPGTKTAVVVTDERIVVPGGHPGASRYAVYVARLDWLDSHGYVVTGWVQQL